MASWISNAVTYHSRCARSLLDALSQSFKTKRGPSSSGPNPVLLFALAPSSTTPPDVLSDIISTLIQLYPQHVGCISAPLPYQYFDRRIRGGPHSCSLAHAFVDGVPFRSTIMGRAETQVGRWHAARRRAEDPPKQTTSDLSGFDGEIDWNSVWYGTPHSVPVGPLESSSQGKGLESKMLPDGLRNLDPSVVSNILYFSDKAPDGLESVLETAFPQANKLCLIASSTPFITGRPVTLFHDGSILPSGAVGVVLNSPASSPPPLELELSFPPLVPLSRNLNVTSSEGNLILSLESGNPTQLLLSAIQKHGRSSSHTTWIGKDDEFYVAVVDPSDRQISQLHRVTAGDPSRGAISLDGASAPKEGAIIRFYRSPRDAGIDVPTYTPGAIRNGVSLFVAPEVAPVASLGDDLEVVENSEGDEVVVLDDFLAASENGFTLSRRGQGPWKCVVSGGRLRLSS